MVAQYTQFDGYPEGQGARILNFLLHSDNIERLKAGLSNIITINCGTVDEMKERIHEAAMSRNMISSKSECRCDACLGEDSWPSLSRETGSQILQIIADSTIEKPVPIFLDLEFANDGLFCEWAYVVDLDTGVFEVFRGAEGKDKASSTRFIDIGRKHSSVPALVKSFSLSALPIKDEFIETLNVAMDEIEWRRNQEEMEEEMACTEIS